jgi:hypothetical protein
VSPNEYPAAELDRAEQALAFILDDQRWPSGDARIPWPFILGSLRGRGFTLGLVEALVKRLTDEGVFQYRRTDIPAGHRWEGGAWHHRSEPEVHEFFVTTRQRWRDYLARRAEGAATPTDRPKTGQAEGDQADRDQGGAETGEGETPGRTHERTKQAEKATPGTGKAQPGQPSKDRQDDIIAAIRSEGTPLTRPELVEKMKLKTEGKLGHHLAWMVANHRLLHIPNRGYWPADAPLPV